MVFYPLLLLSAQIIKSIKNFVSFLDCFAQVVILFIMIGKFHVSNKEFLTPLWTKGYSVHTGMEGFFNTLVLPLGKDGIFFVCTVYEWGLSMIFFLYEGLQLLEQAVLFQKWAYIGMPCFTPHSLEYRIIVSPSLLTFEKFPNPPPLVFQPSLLLLICGKMK